MGCRTCSSSTLETNQKESQLAVSLKWQPQYNTVVPTITTPFFLLFWSFSLKQQDGGHHENSRSSSGWYALLTLLLSLSFDLIRMGWTLSRPPLCRVIIDLQQTSGHQLHLATATTAAVAEKLFLFKMAFSYCTPSFVLAIAAARIIVVVSDTSFRWRRRSALSLSAAAFYIW